MTDAIPAATLVVFRGGGGHQPELLVVRRAMRMAFAAGALAFPGGRVDPGDHRIAADPAFARGAAALDPDDAAARVAAIRETIEESGVTVAIDPSPPIAVIDAIRAALEAGEEFAVLLDRHRLTLDLDALVPFARWRPNLVEVRIFDARFYIAHAAPGAPDPRVDATENSHVFWATAAAVLDAHARGEVRVIYPTRRNFERLAQFDSFDAACADAAAHGVETITPWIEERGGTEFLCIPTDRGYPVTAEPMASVTRG